MENNDIKRKEYIALLRNDLKKMLYDYSYELTFDNRNENQSESKNWIFKIIYSGQKTIEISNDDWRDYTEYFNLIVNGKEIFTLNINEYQDLQKALNDMKTHILNIL